LLTKSKELNTVNKKKSRV